LNTISTIQYLNIISLKETIFTNVQRNYRICIGITTFIIGLCLLYYIGYTDNKNKNNSIQIKVKQNYEKEKIING
tara:strand:+ start:803 stop:1027 length:225 start_codon:yes stop_codon:yes gene_type:complete